MTIIVIGTTQYPVIFPVHPRTKKNLQNFNVGVPSNVTLIDPLGYMDFLSLMSKSKLILTDSGEFKRIYYNKKVLHYPETYVSKM